MEIRWKYAEFSESAIDLERCVHSESKTEANWVNKNKYKINNHFNLIQLRINRQGFPYQLTPSTAIVIVTIIPNQCQCQSQCEFINKPSLLPCGIIDIKWKRSAHICWSHNKNVNYRNKCGSGMSHRLRSFNIWYMFIRICMNLNDKNISRKI